MNYTEILNVPDININIKKIVSKLMLYKNYIILFSLFLIISFAIIIGCFFLKTLYIDGKGVLLPENVIPIYFETNGKIKKIYKNDGDYINEGETIFDIDTENLEKNLVILNKQKENYLKNYQLLIEKKNITEMDFYNSYNFQNEKVKNAEKLLSINSISKYEYEFEKFRLEEYKNRFYDNLNSIKIGLNEIEKNLVDINGRIEQILYEISRATCQASRNGYLIINQHIFREKSEQLFLLPNYYEGQLVSAGEFLGYIYKEDSYIAKVNINEKYLNNLDFNTKCSITFLNKRFSGFIKNIESIGINGFYTVTIKINNPEGLRKYNGIILNITIKAKRKLRDFFDIH